MPHFIWAYFLCTILRTQWNIILPRCKVHPLLRSQLFSMADQLGVDLAQPSYNPDQESLASVSTVCLEGTDNQLI